MPHSIRDWEHSAMPRSERQPLYKVSAVWINFVFVPVFINFAYNLGHRMTLAGFIGAIIVGCSILAICSTISGVIGEKTGLSAGLLVSRVFGRTGGRIVAILTPLLLIGWDSFSLDLVGTETVFLYGHANYRWLFILAFMIIFATTATAGFRFLAPMSVITIPIMIGLMVWALVLAMIQKGGIVVPAPIGPTEPFASAVTKVVGLFALGSNLCSPDIQRFCRSTKDAVLVGVYTFLFALPFLLIVGGLTSLIIGKGSMISAFAVLGLVTIGFLNFLLLSWSSCDNDYYSAALGIAAVTGYKKAYLVPPIALVAAAVAIFGIGKYLEPWLIIMTTIAIPISGVFISDGLTGAIKDDSGSRSHFRTSAVISWACGAVVSYTSTLYEIGIPPIHGMVVAFVVQYLLTRRERQNNRNVLPKAS